MTENGYMFYTARVKNISYFDISENAFKIISGQFYHMPINHYWFGVGSGWPFI